MIEVDDQEALSADENDEQGTEDVVRKASESDAHSGSEKSQ